MSEKLDGMILKKNSLAESRMKKLMQTLALLLGITASLFQAQSQIVSFDWATQFSGNVAFEPMAIAVDDTGFVYTTGRFSQPIDFDPGLGTVTLTPAQGDVFICKQNPGGAYMWALQLGGAAIDGGYDIAVSDSGVFVIGGYDATQNTPDTIDLDPGAGTRLVTGSGTFIAHFSHGGSLKWLVDLNDGFSDYEDASIALDDSSNVYTAGRVGAAADFDPGAGVLNLGAGSAFLYKLSPTGDLVWVQDLTDDVRPVGLAFDTAANIYTTGDYLGTVDFHPGTPTFNLTGSATGGNGYVSKFGVDGNFKWVRGYSGGTVNARAITIDHNGNVLTTGTFSGTIDFDPTMAQSNTSSFGTTEDVYICKWDGAAGFEWIRTLESNVSQIGTTAIVVDEENAVYTTGTFALQWDFDPGVGFFPLTANGSDVFVHKLRENGAFDWVRQVESPQNDRSSDLAIDTLGALYTMGLFTATADFNPETPVFNLTSATGSDFFVQKYTPCYTRASITAIGCSSYISPGGKTFIASGVYQDTIMNMQFCDSILTIDLTLTNTVEEDTVLSCGDFTWPVNGQTYTTSGIFADTLANVFNCDSVWILNLTIGNEVDTLVIDTCDSFFWDATGLTYDSTQFVAATMPNALGCDSTTVLNLTIRLSTSDTMEVNACGPYLWNLNGQTYVTPGTYSFMVTNAANCDSVVVLDLEITEVDVSITETGDSLIANAVNADYQWINCPGNLLRTPDTTAIFLPPTNTDGSYAVEVTQNGCVDTSECVFYNPIGIADIDAASFIQVFPNPTAGLISVDLGPEASNATLALRNALGQQLMEQRVQNTRFVDLDVAGPAGIYFLEVRLSDGSQTHVRLLKN